MQSRPSERAVKRASLLDTVYIRGESGSIRVSSARQPSCRISTLDASCILVGTKAQAKFRRSMGAARSNCTLPAQSQYRRRIGAIRSRMKSSVRL